MACRNTNVHFLFDWRAIEVDGRPLVYLLASCRVRASIVDLDSKTLREILKLFEHKFFLCAWRPLRPTGALFIKWCFLILTFIEQLFCQLIELWDLSGMSSRRPDRSSSFNGPSTWFLCSDVSAKLPMLKDQGVYWNDDVNDGPEGGGVVGCGNGLVRASTSYSPIHIF